MDRRDWIWAGPRLRYIIEAQEKLASQLEKLVKEMQNSSLPPTTAEPTTTAPIEDSQWDAPEQVTITPTDSPSQSATAEPMSGPVAPYLTCAHNFQWVRENWNLDRCINNCGAYRFNEQILVPAALTTSSTSPKQPSRSSVVLYNAEFASSPSSDSTNQEKTG